MAFVCYKLIFILENMHPEQRNDFVLSFFDYSSYNPCKNAEISAWILSNNIADSHSFHWGVGEYNSLVPYFNLSVFIGLDKTIRKLNRF